MDAELFPDRDRGSLEKVRSDVGRANGICLLRWAKEMQCWVLDVINTEVESPTVQLGEAAVEDPLAILKKRLGDKPLDWGIDAYSDVVEDEMVVSIGTSGEIAPILDFVAKSVENEV